MKTQRSVGYTVHNRSLNPDPKNIKDKVRYNRPASGYDVDINNNMPEEPQPVVHADNHNENAKSITNADAQRQATNTSGNAMGENEIEGDRQLVNRFNPYRTVYDDPSGIDRGSPDIE